MEEAIKYLGKGRRRGVKISDLAGSWDLADEDAEDVKNAIDRAWKKWKLEGQ